VALGQIIDDRNRMSGFFQRPNRVAADVPGSAGDHHSRQRYLPME
jgi:hypothetical protein